MYLRIRVKSNTKYLGYTSQFRTAERVPEEFENVRVSTLTFEKIESRKSSIRTLTDKAVVNKSQHPYIREKGAIRRAKVIDKCSIEYFHKHGL